MYLFKKKTHQQQQQRQHIVNSQHERLVKGGWGEIYGRIRQGKRRSGFNMCQKVCNDQGSWPGRPGMLAGSQRLCMTFPEGRFKCTQAIEA